jgi:hypothetical protein
VQGDTVSWGNNTVIGYSDIMGGLTDSMVVSEEDTVYWLEGNMNVNPLFIEPDSGDFRVQEGSPCIDAGTAFFIWQGDTIINLSESEYNGQAPDMGAFESAYTGMGKKRINIAKTYYFAQNYPNPFNPETMIEYFLPVKGRVSITIYNILGQHVRKLMDDFQEAGIHHVSWNGTDDSGQALPSGAYLIQMHSGDFMKFRKVLLLK